MLKNMNTRIRKYLVQSLAVGALIVLAQSAQSQVIYNNTTTSENGNFNYTVEAGNEVVAGPPADKGVTATFSDFISSASIQFDLVQGSAPNTTPLGTEEVELNIYQNNGALFNGYVAPGTRLYSSTFFTMSQLGITSFTDGTKLTFNNINTAVPPDFTWTVAFGNLASGEAGGLAMYNLPTVGGNYQDAWVNTGTVASPAWVLDVATPGTPQLQFAATFSAPEPSTIALGVMGACAFLARYRRK